MKKAISIFLILILVLTQSFVVTLADEISDKQNELDRIKNEKKDLQAALNEGKKEVNGLNKEIAALEGNIASLNLEIEELTVTISMTEDSINKATEHLTKVKEDIDRQQQYLGDRLAAMYMNGNIGVVDVLLGSSSISEFMSNLDRVQMIYDADKQMLSALKTQASLIAAQEEYLEGLKVKLADQRAAETEKKAEIQADRDEVAAKKAEVAADNKELEQMLNNLNKEADRITSEILRLQSNGEFVGGNFTWPVPGVSRITSNFGYRIHPILGYKKLHTGLDIGAPSGSKVVASNDGKVIKAGWNNSYGYMVMIDHGGGIVTLYAHNTSLSVSTGQTVAKGQQIARSGSTGDSTGPHVHFEVRVNGSYVDPLGYVRYGS